MSDDEYGDDYDDDEVECQEPLCVYEGVVKQSWQVEDLLYVTVRTAANVVGELAGGIHMLANIVAGQCNYMRDKKEFIASASRAIESLTQEDRS